MCGICKELMCTVISSRMAPMLFDKFGMIIEKFVFCFHWQNSEIIKLTKNKIIIFSLTLIEG